MKKYNLDDVFGLTRDIPLTYVERDDVDGKFKKNLRRGRHIIVFGSTKQGKTCLKKHILQEDEYINIQCNNKWSITEINTNILKMAGYQIEASSKKQKAVNQR